MKVHRLSLISAGLLTFAMSVIVYVFHVYRSDFNATQQNFYPTLLAALFVGFSFNYLVIEFLFKTYGKNQIKKLSHSLPSEILNDEEKNIGFKELSERISGLNQKNITEIDTMKDMEIYRREYIGNVSHELKTPLFSIQGYVETLIDGGVENLNIRDKYLERIDKSVERLINIVTDLDMINKYEAGEINLRLENFDINSLIKETFELLDLEAQKMGAKLILQTSAPLWVNADKQRISQVLINLVSNAIHYSNREKAQVIVSTKPIGNKVLVEVQDNGMGIKPEVLPRIFERFFRAESSRNRKDGGSGLGLAIVKHILHAHGENIEAKSTYLEGTIFRFLLKKEKKA